MTAPDAADTPIPYTLTPAAEAWFAMTAEEREAMTERDTDAEESQ